ncbi:RimJ/RimL family protein N-acetyltransferase [Arthrobacter sp. CAN_A6]|uniref:GNAT family N-acetyltransferase n=1 Tax=Arthrobacter sp. CAN_A6 TaxID=2787721 RepID=UPI0018CBD2E3
MDNREIPAWPVDPPTHGPIRLRMFEDRDVPMALDLSQDSYVPTIGTLPAQATYGEALFWLRRQRQRHLDGTGFSFAIADAMTDRALGQVGLWVRNLSEGRATAGYGVAPQERGRHVAAAAVTALTAFAWTIPSLHRIELYIEPWNTASVRVAERAGYEREGRLRSHQEISGERVDMFLYAAVRGG